LVPGESTGGLPTSSVTQLERMFCAAKYKRLEEGVFHVPAEDSGGVEIDVPRLTLILEGIDLSEAKQQRRFSRPRAGT